MLTIDELFAEDFKPQWLAEKERFEYESYLYATSVIINFNWRKNAEAINKRVASRYKPKKPV